MPLDAAQRQQLRLQCRTVVPGYRSLTPAEDFHALARWCEAEGAQADVYGAGGLAARLETQVADLLGMPAAVLMPSGVMAQLIAVRLHCEAARLNRVALSPTSHLVLHEQEAPAALFGLHGVPLGSRLQPVRSADLAAIQQPLACALLELPMREIGGQLPSWDELAALKAQAVVQGVPLHLDGARLWPCRAAYGRSYAEIVAGFASVYVSLYKDIGGQAGALLLGAPEFIAQARLWQRRMGGNLVQQTALAGSALMRLDARLGLQEACLQRARELAAGLQQLRGLSVLPAVPQTNLMHLHFDVEAEALNDARDALAESESCWLLGNARAVDVPGRCVVELTVGDALLALDNGAVLPWFERVLAQAGSGRALRA